MAQALTARLDGGWGAEIRPRLLAWANRPAGGLALLIVTTLLARLLFAWALGLGVDESYMVAAGRHLALGYFDHPPAAWWMAWAAAHVFGTDAPVVVRLPFVLMFAGTTWLMYRLTALLYGACAALWAAALLNAAPVFGLTTGSWVLPDGPLMFFLLGGIYGLARALRAEAAGARRAALGWWLVAGLGLGLAMFSKYTAVLSLAGVFLFLVSERTGRRLLARPAPWLALLVACLVFAPVVAWNAAHGWASFAFQAGRAGGHRLHVIGPLATLGGESLFLLPWIWLPLCWAGIAAWRRPEQSEDRLLVWLALVPIALFELVSLRSHVLFHWAAPGYLALFPLLGRMVARHRAGNWAVRAWLAGNATIVVLGAVLVGTEVRFNWLPAVGEHFALGRDPDIQAVDWTSVADGLRARGLLAGDALVAATRWHDAGKIDYALGGLVPVLCLGRDPREYGLLNGGRARDGARVVIVAPDDDLARVARAYGGLFDRIVAVPPVMLDHAGRPAMRVPVFVGYDLHWP